jgi:predicted PurR-regulated permease PerM
LKASIHGVIRGALVIAGIQGIISGIGFAIFGVPNAVLWGSLAAVCALVPTLGTTLVFVPIVGYLALTGHIPQAIGLAVWGIFAVGLIDNILGPRLMSQGSSIHPFFILIAVLGGVDLFGPVGLFAGPLVVALFFALFDTYKVHISGKSSPVKVRPSKALL